ncbi:MAG: hypothetical protein R6X15_01970 [Pseudomonadota bacterium]
MKKISLILLFAFSYSLPAHEDAVLLERIELLEQRVELLEKKYAVSRPEIETEDALIGQAMVRYWLGKKSPFPVSTEQPLATGKTKLDQDFNLRPQDYGVTIGDGSLFSKQLDPSLYPFASLSVDGVLKLPDTGEYTLVMKPTPPREVGGAGNVELAVDIYLDGKKVLSQPYSSSLAQTQVQLTLTEGETAFRMELVSRSPGFGPSPTKATLFVGLKTGDSVSPEPIGQFLLPPH